MAAEYVVASVTLAFTAAESSLRKVCFVFLLGLAVVETRLLPFLSGPEQLRGVFAFSCFVKSLHFVSLFFILRVEIAQLLPQNATPSARFLAALNCVTSTRGIGTPWEVKPRTQRGRDRDQPPKSKPKSRTQYIAKTLLTLIWQYVALDLLNFGAVRYFQREWPGALSASAEFLGPASSKEQLLARLPLSCLLLVNLRLLFSMIHRVIAVVVVGLFAGDPEKWPPLFGRVWDLRYCRVRDCWAIYWHSLLRWPLATISTALQARYLPATPRKAHQLTHLFLIFTISGILHVLSAIYAGVPDNIGAIFLFFVGNAAAIVVEDVVRPRPPPRARRDSDETAWSCFLGFLGLLAWTFVSVPLFAYTALRIPVQTNVVMPVSLVERVGGRVVAGGVFAGWVAWNTVIGG
ncbi:membrane bound O-acyl transferase family-domain-containing protein [Aspergillus carlsbadensis]|nr:membrane bound O-acyl transferase family-domain-containing protein [Aspergillus carlsbadensis]